jgi:hypothetical protein
MHYDEDNHHIGFSTKINRIWKSLHQGTTDIFVDDRK